MNNKRVEILYTWKSYFGDIRFNANLYKNDKLVANIIGSNNVEKHKKLKGKSKLVDYVYENFNSFINLPKISKCSNLLQEIFNDVCFSESNMCYIDENDWNNYYSENYSKQDIEKLKTEIKKYNLEDLISINCDGFKIIGYGDLATRFNNDRKIKKERDERGDR